MQHSEASCVKSGAIYLYAAKPAHSLIFTNRVAYIENNTHVALKEVGLGLGDFSTSNDVKRSVSITCEALTTSEGILRNLVLPAADNLFYHKIRFENPYFIPVSKTYPELVFECSNPHIFLESIVLLYQSNYATRI